MELLTQPLNSLLQRNLNLTGFAVSTIPAERNIFYCFSSDFGVWNLEFSVYSLLTAILGFGEAIVLFPVFMRIFLSVTKNCSHIRIHNLSFAEKN
jgi:hypothetical protein